MIKKIKVKLQKSFSGDFRVVQITNAINVTANTFSGGYVRFSPGTMLTEAAAEVVCADRKLEVTINDMTP